MECYDIVYMLIVICYCQAAKAEDLQIGGFNWAMMHRWDVMTAYEKGLKKYPTDPTRYMYTITIYTVYILSH